MDKKYYVIGPRNAWDTVEIGLFSSSEEAKSTLGYPNDESIIREATPQEIEDYLDKQREKISCSTIYFNSGVSIIFE